MVINPFKEAYVKVDVPAFDRVVQTRTKQTHLRTVTKPLQNSLMDDGLRLGRKSHGVQNEDWLQA